MNKILLFITGLMFFIVIAFISKETIAEGKAYKVGERGPAGGWVFYDKGSFTDGWRYLEAAPEDQSEGVQWFNGKFVKTGASGIKAGTGKSNTQKIISVQGEGVYAAKICAEYRGGGKNDWFLPSKDELDLMYHNLHLEGLGDFTTYTYSSSTEKSQSAFWCQDFYEGPYDSTKKGKDRVRAVRAF